MENIRLKKITVSPLETLIIHNGNVQLVNTNESSNVVSGAFISNGGISINSTYNSTSSSVGGSLTVGGGVGIIKNLYVGQDLTLDNSNSIFKINGVSENRIYLDNIINKQFYISVDGVNKRLELYDTYLKLNYTSSSSNSSTGSLIINGGISINCTSNASSITQGGALTVAGGTSIKKDIYVGQSAYINGSTYIEDSLYVKSNITASNLYLVSDITTSNLLSTNINTTNITTTKLIATTGLTSANANITTLNCTNSNFTNVTTSTIRLIDGIVTNISTGTLNANGGITSSNALITTLTGTNSNFTNVTTSTIRLTDGIATNISTSVLIASTGITSATANITSITGTNSDFTNISSSNANITNSVFTNTTINSLNVTNASITNITTSSIIVSNISASSINVSANISSSNIDINGTLNCNNTSTFTGNTTSTNSSTGTIVLTRGGLSINATTNSSSQTNGGALTVNGGVAIAKDLYIGLGMSAASANITTLNGTNSVFTNFSTGTLQVSTGITTASANITNLTGTNISFTNITTSTLRVTDDISTNISTGTLIASSYINGIGNSNTIGNIFTTGGNVGIGRTSPNFALDVNGSINANIYTGENISISGNMTSGGLLVINGTDANVLITNNINIYSTTASNDVSSGSLVVGGGVGVGGNLNVLGNTVINGNLTVSGSTVTVDSINTTVKDNIYVLNSGPSGTRDSGFIIQRYQVDNDTGSGDVVTDTRYISDILPSQAGITSTQVKLSTGASAVNNYYNGWWIKVASGFSNNQVRKITSYVGSTRLATISSAWNTQNPAGGDSVYLYNKPYIGVIYNEVADNFVFGSTVEDPGQTNVTFTDEIPIKVFSSLFTSTQQSTNSTTGALVSYGGISINCTENSSNITRGGSFTTLGGGSFAKDIYVGGNLSVNGPIMKIPTGNTANRPASPQDGYIYYNTDDTEYQGYLGSSWVSLSATGTLSDLDGNTKIIAEAFSGSNDNNLKFFTNGIEIMRINSAGNIGINTTSPGAALHLQGEALFSSTINSTGVGTGGTLTVLGGASFSKDVYVGGTITSSSDIRLKDNITELDNENISDKLTKLRTVKFNYKHDPKEMRQFGFIAQDFIEDFPELLRKPDENGYYTLDYAKITVLLVESIKELKNEIANLKDEIKILKK